MFAVENQPKNEVNPLTHDPTCENEVSPLILDSSPQRDSGSGSQHIEGSTPLKGMGRNYLASYTNKGPKLQISEHGRIP